MSRVLVIEDELPIRELICELLQIENYEVLEAENGEEGLALARLHLPDLIICDVMMPNLDGYQVLEKLQGQTETANISFIFLTAKGTNQDVRRGMKLGADDYLIKPFNSEDLLDAVTTRLRKQQNSSLFFQKKQAETPQELEILLGRSPDASGQKNTTALISQKEEQLLNQLEKAIAEQQLQLYYQPQFNLQTRELTGCEALLRWFHPQRGSISPGVFIPVAEKTDLILPLGQWVIETACSQWLHWQNLGLKPVRIAVNLSARQLQQPQFIPWFLDHLCQRKISPPCLEVELTETTLVQNVARSCEQLHSLKEQGILVAIDDFGTGYSSLGYLQQFSFDVLKIDRCFIHNVNQNPTNAVLTRAMISMAHHLGLRVIAEGVETQAEFDFLKLNDCDELQGYLFSPALAPNVFTEYLQRGPTTAIATQKSKNPPV
jgi:EAL domain-containing protein (putative c-di-GMP-specific phosphodiesterase class I)/ActR/RegA family two-component response regulator